VKVRILSVETETGRITASIQKAASTQPAPAISDLGVGDIVSGSVSEVHKDNVLLSLAPSQAKALLSLNNLANHRNVSVAQLRASLKAGELLNNLIVVSRNQDKGIVIVANRPAAKAPITQGKALTIDTVEVGSVVGGRVLRHTRKGALVKLNARITGLLHPTDCSDDFEDEKAFPGVDTILKAVVVEVDKSRNQLILSTRRSRTNPTLDDMIADPEINGIQDLTPGQTIRGFIKNVSEHGLYVMLGRCVDARVQIRELFDEVCAELRSHRPHIHSELLGLVCKGLEKSFLCQSDR
jgi:rRNA biogenesis protein RRP5